MSIQSQLLTSAFAVSRAGEVRWVCFPFWTFDTQFFITNIGWCGLKTSNFYLMSFYKYLDPDKFDVDNIHICVCACM